MKPNCRWSRNTCGFTFSPIRVLRCGGRRETPGIRDAFDRSILVFSVILKQLFLNLIISTTSPYSWSSHDATFPLPMSSLLHRLCACASLLHSPLPLPSRHARRLPPLLQRPQGEKDWEKYEVARKLKSLVDDIRYQYNCDLKSKQMNTRQRAVALYFIDKVCVLRLTRNFVLFLWYKMNCKSFHLKSRLVIFLILLFLIFFFF